MLGLPEQEADVVVACGAWVIDEPAAVADPVAADGVSDRAVRQQPAAKRLAIVGIGRHATQQTGADQLVGTGLPGLITWTETTPRCILNQQRHLPGMRMIDAIIAWDLEDDAEGNVHHIAQNGITMDEVEEVLLNEKNLVGESRSSGRPITFGETSTGKRIAVVWEQALDNPLMIRRVTAFETE